MEAIGYFSALVLCILIYLYFHNQSEQKNSHLQDMVRYYNNHSITFRAMEVRPDWPASKLADIIAKANNNSIIQREVEQSKKRAEEGQVRLYNSYSYTYNNIDQVLEIFQENTTLHVSELQNRMRKIYSNPSIIDDKILEWERNDCISRSANSFFTVTYDLIHPFKKGEYGTPLMISISDYKNPDKRKAFRE
jgi:hypothetical protein